jgi:uncharacterized protein YjaZ
MSIWAPVSYGELIDKITILEIKANMFPDGEARDNVDKELKELYERYDFITSKDSLETLGVALEDVTNLKTQLTEINEELWGIEDKLREFEPEMDKLLINICPDLEVDEVSAVMAHEFIKLARLVYKTNDERSRVKKDINMLLGSDLVEEKLLPQY